MIDELDITVVAPRTVQGSLDAIEGEPLRQET
jgi:hypothetical protein